MRERRKDMRLPRLSGFVACFLLAILAIALWPRQPASPEVGRVKEEGREDEKRYELWIVSGRQQGKSKEFVLADQSLGLTPDDKPFCSATDPKSKALRFTSNRRPVEPAEAKGVIVTAAQTTQYLKNAHKGFNVSWADWGTHLFSSVGDSGVVLLSMDRHPEDMPLEQRETDRRDLEQFLGLVPASMACFRRKGEAQCDGEGRGGGAEQDGVFLRDAYNEYRAYTVQYDAPGGGVGETLFILAWTHRTMPWAFVSDGFETPKDLPPDWRTPKCYSTPFMYTRMCTWYVYDMFHTMEGMLRFFHFFAKIDTDIGFLTTPPENLFRGMAEREDVFLHTSLVMDPAECQAGLREFVKTRVDVESERCERQVLPAILDKAERDKSSAGEAQHVGPKTWWVNEGTREEPRMTKHYRKSHPWFNWGDETDNYFVWYGNFVGGALGYFTSPEVMDFAQEFVNYRPGPYVARWADQGFWPNAVGLFSDGTAICDKTAWRDKVFYHKFRPK